MNSEVSRQVAGAVERSAKIWPAFQGKSLLLTGGTGFFGRWLLEVLTVARTRFHLDLDVVVITRDVEAFRRKAPLLAAASFIRLHQGDICSFTRPVGRFSYVIHGAATSAKATFDGEAPLKKFVTAWEGTRRVLDLAVETAAERVLMLGSGSVYGLSTKLGPVSEQYPGAPLTLDTDAALGHGKRASEFLCACYADQFGIPITIARCFSFVGAYLPMNIHYAIGNFIRDALYFDAITVRGDGSPIRSYLFAGDLVHWLLTLLLYGQSRRCYNVGSDEMITLAELATLVRDVIAPGKPVHILGQTQAGPRSCYVPDISRARDELGLAVWTPLADAIRLTGSAAMEERWADG